MSARYEALSRGSSGRALYYLARRHLSMSPPEWDALSWWEQRVYIEGFRAEGFLSDGSESSRGSVDNFHGALSGRPGDLAALGFTERTL